MPDSSSCSVVSSQPSEVDVSKSKKSADSRIDLGDITPHNLKLLKKVNQVKMKNFYQLKINVNLHRVYHDRIFWLSTLYHCYFK